MARGESQGLLIFAIISLVFGLIMIAVTWVMYSKYTDTASKFASATEENRKLSTENGTLKSEGTKLRSLIGFPDATTAIADVEKKFEEEMIAYAPKDDAGAPLIGKTYRDALGQLNQSYRAEVGKLADSIEKNLALQNLVDKQNEKEALLQASMQQQLDKANKEFIDAQATFTKNQNELIALNKKNEEEKNQAIKEKNDTIKLAKDSIGKAVDEKLEVLNINQNLTKTIANLQSPTVTYATAKVTYISPDGTKVWINMGRDDGLTAGISFSVYSPSVRDVAVDTSKGKIEVTKILDAHRAEARVTEDILLDPILINDLIYTPVWKPGQKPRFALSNGLDIDGDGISDTQAIINIIRMNGGEVDAYIEETGGFVTENNVRLKNVALIGKVTDQTQIYVVGPAVGPEPELEKLREARTQLDTMVDNLAEGKTASASESNGAAKDLDTAAWRHSLKKITLEDLLQRMGYRKSIDVTGFGDRHLGQQVIMKPELMKTPSTGTVYQGYETPDMPSAPTNGLGVTSPLFNQQNVNVSPGSTSPLFRPRKPTTDSIRYDK